MTGEAKTQNARKFPIDARIQTAVGQIKRRGNTTLNQVTAFGSLFNNLARSKMEPIDGRELNKVISAVKDAMEKFPSCCTAVWNMKNGLARFDLNNCCSMLQAFSNACNELEDGHLKRALVQHKETAKKLAAFLLKQPDITKLQSESQSFLQTFSAGVKLEAPTSTTSHPSRPLYLLLLFSPAGLLGGLASLTFFKEMDTTFISRLLSPVSSLVTTAPVVLPIIAFSLFVVLLLLSFYYRTEIRKKLNKKQYEPFFLGLSAFLLLSAGILFVVPGVPMIIGVGTLVVGCASSVFSIFVFSKSLAGKELSLKGWPALGFDLLLAADVILLVSPVVFAFLPISVPPLLIISTFTAGGFLSVFTILVTARAMDKNDMPRWGWLSIVLPVLSVGVVFIPATEGVQLLIFIVAYASSAVVARQGFVAQGKVKLDGGSHSNANLQGGANWKQQPTSVLGPNQDAPSIKFFKTPEEEKVQKTAEETRIINAICGTRGGTQQLVHQTDLEGIVVQAVRNDPWKGQIPPSGDDRKQFLRSMRQALVWNNEDSQKLIARLIINRLEPAPTDANRGEIEQKVLKAVQQHTFSNAPQWLSIQQAFQGSDLPRGLVNTLETSSSTIVDAVLASQSFRDLKLTVKQKTQQDMTALQTARAEFVKAELRLESLQEQDNLEADPIGQALLEEFPLDPTAAVENN